MCSITILWLVSVCLVGSQATTHWMVTESGLIQPKLESPFEMARPYDLLEFLNQDTRYENIVKLYHQLSHRQTVIKNLWTDFVKKVDISDLLSMDEKCIDAGPVTTLDWYRPHFEDGTKKNIPEGQFALYKPDFGKKLDVPDCKKISSLVHSPYTFEHLNGVRHRENLTVKPEQSLPEQIDGLMTVDQFGHWLSIVLRQNTTSWLHYNLAALFWRVKGNAPKAMECSRRAVHHAPSQHKDIALLGMGMILHRSRRTSDAIVVMQAAVEHDPRYYVNHFMLANAYAVQGEFNKSLKHYDECLKLRPSFNLAMKHKYGVMCHITLDKRLQEVKGLLVTLKREMLEYTPLESQWLKSQSAFLRAMKHPQDYEAAEQTFKVPTLPDYRNIENNCLKMTEITGLNIKELKKEGDKNGLLQYFLEGPVFEEKWLDEKGIEAINGAFNLQRLVQHLDEHAYTTSEFVAQAREKMKMADELSQAQIKVNDKDTIVKEIGRLPLFPDRGESGPEIIVYVQKKGTPNSETKRQKMHRPTLSTTPEPLEDFTEFETGTVMYPPTMQISRTTQDFDTEPDWPSNKLCKDNAAIVPDNIEAIFPVFLPFENKGIRLISLLTDMIGVPAHSEHELPWFPPTCPQAKELAAFTQKKAQKQLLVSEVVQTDFLKYKLFEYIGDGNVDLAKGMQDAEIGQRIYSAMEMDLAPKWIVYTLSSLYWRVRGNNLNALSCLLNAVKTVKTRYKDVVLTSLASVYLEMGHFDEALHAAEEAFRLSMYEPATNFVLAEINMIKKQRTTHMFHLKQVVRVEPTFMDGLARNLLYGWGCILKQVNALTEFDFGEGDTCTQVEPGVSMVCHKDGTNCHVANVACFTASERDSSTVVRMLELKVDGVDHPDYIDEDIFDPFVDNMPYDRGDRAGHYENFQIMMRIVNKSLMGCGPRGCSTITPEDLALKENGCTYQGYQLGYWLHVLIFRQLFSETDFRLPPEIPMMAPTNKKVPECRLAIDNSEDFFLERLSRVDSKNWEPVISLMHQFADLFDHFDFHTLGPKFAKFVDTKPRSWEGALGAGWWCGAGGRGECAVRCLAAAYALSPPDQSVHALRALAALLHMQYKHQDAKEVAYLTFYMSPKNKHEAFLAGVSHSYLAEYEQAIWMYRYALMFDSKFLPAKACLHASLCLMFFGEIAKEPKTGTDAA